MLGVDILIGCKIKGGYNWRYRNCVDAVNQELPEILDYCSVDTGYLSNVMFHSTQRYHFVLPVGQYIHMQSAFVG